MIIWGIEKPWFCVESAEKILKDVTYDPPYSNDEQNMHGNEIYACFTFRNMEEIYQQEQHIGHLQNTINSLGAPLKVAQSRLALRANRPELEACRDSPHHK